MRLLTLVFLLPLFLVSCQQPQTADATGADSTSVYTPDPNDPVTIDGVMYMNGFRPYVREVDSARVAELVPEMRVTEDEFEDLTVYQHDDSPRYINSRDEMYLYVVDQGPDEEPSLLFRSTFEDDSWAFIEEIKVKVGDTVHEISTPSQNTKRDAVSGGIYEAHTFMMNLRPVHEMKMGDTTRTEDDLMREILDEVKQQQVIDLVRDLVSYEGTEPVRIRYEGDRRVNRTMRESEIDRMQVMLDFYDARGGDLDRYVRLEEEENDDMEEVASSAR